MVSDADLIELIKCKYLANAEYLKSVLADKNIYAEINFDDHSITVNRSNLKEAKELISKEDLDETETIDQENFMEGFNERNNNNVDPGHYLSGNIPYFYRTGSN